jgi:hypothetical protein
MKTRNDPLIGEAEGEPGVCVERQHSSFSWRVLSTRRSPLFHLGFLGFARILRSRELIPEPFCLLVSRIQPLRQVKLLRLLYFSRDIIEQRLETRSRARWAAT